MGWFIGLFVTANLLIVALWVALGVYLFFVLLVRKRPVRFLVPARADDPEHARLTLDESTGSPSDADSNPYAAPRVIDDRASTNRSLALLGFTCGGLFRVERGALSIPVALWMAPDRRTLAVVAWWKRRRTNGGQTIFLTRVRGGTVLVTSDTFDVQAPGNCESIIVHKCPFVQLSRRHRLRLDHEEREVLAFLEDDALSAYESILVDYHDCAVAQNEERYIDDAHQFVRSTWRGAFLGFLRYLRATFTVERIPYPGADPVPFQVFPDKLTPFFRYAPWIFLVMTAIGGAGLFGWIKVAGPNRLGARPDPWLIMIPFVLFLWGLVGFVCTGLIRLLYVSRRARTRR